MRREGILICRPIRFNVPVPIIDDDDDDDDGRHHSNPNRGFAFQRPKLKIKKGYQVKTQQQAVGSSESDESSEDNNGSSSSSSSSSPPSVNSLSVSVLGRRLHLPIPIPKIMPPFASMSLSSSSSSSSSSCCVGVNVEIQSAKKMGNRAIGDGFKPPSAEQLAKHPLALLAMVPEGLSLFFAGALAGAAAKTLTAPLDRIKLLMQTHGLRAAGSGTNKGIGFIEAITLIRMEEGVNGYWKGNLPQVIRIIPYSAVQLFAYEVYKKLFKKKNSELSIVGRLAAGACAGMTSTFVTYPLDVLRLRLAVEPGCITMSQVAFNMLREEGIGSFYGGLGPSLLGIAPYIAVNFCIFDLVKKSLPEKYQEKPEISLAAALMSATLATFMCYPLDTVRRQMQMKGSPYNTVFDAFPGIWERDGFLGLYRGFVPNALKNLPNSSIRLTTFDTVKGLIKAGQKELQNIMEENQDKS